MVAMTARQRLILLSAAGIGAALEVFEFTLFGIFALQIGRAYMPTTDPAIALIGAFATFGVAFLARPVGALIFGHVGDTRGRKVAMSASILAMSLSTAAVGAIPGYTSIGLAAPVLLVLVRLLQGFAMAGEVSGVVAFVVEFGQPERRGRSAGWTITFFFIGNILGVLTAITLNAILGEAAVAAWGWRLAFFLALPAGMLGLYLRLNFPDTPAFEKLKAHGELLDSPVRTALRDRWRSIVLLMLLYSGQVACGYLINTFLANYLETSLHVGRQTALIAYTATTAAVAVAAPLWGAVGDRIGYAKALVLAYVGVLLYIFPLFIGLRKFAGTTGALILTEVGFGLLFGCLASSMAITSVTLFPANVRYTGASVGYNMATTVFGGTLPLVASTAILWTGNIVAPAYYVALVLTCSLIAAAAALRGGQSNRY